MAETREELQILEGCQVSLEDKQVVVKGEKGELKKVLYNPKINFTVESGKLVLSAKKLTKPNKKLINTYKAIIINMFKGVTEGHTYKLKICSGHFPMSVTVKGEGFEIKNFIGEKVPRIIKIKPETKVTIDGDEIIVEGINKEATGQMAASIEQMTRRPGFDKRIFQDGIYMTEKDGKEL